jgi:hypothetical protein
VNTAMAGVGKFLVAEMGEQWRRPVSCWVGPVRRPRKAASGCPDALPEALPIVISISA